MLGREGKKFLEEIKCSEHNVYIKYISGDSHLRENAWENKKFELNKSYFDDGRYLISLKSLIYL